LPYPSAPAKEKIAVLSLACSVILSVESAVVVVFRTLASIVFLRMLRETVPAPP
jgi:hypothetical protein